MYNVTKVEVISDVNVGSILQKKENGLFEALSEERYRLFCEAFAHTINERFPQSERLPKETSFALRTVVSDDKARYVRLFELSTKFMMSTEDDKKIQYDLTFEIYKTPEGDEDCELLSYYSAQYKPKEENEG